MKHMVTDMEIMIAETIMGVMNPKYSEKKQKMYDAAKAWFVVRKR